MTIGYYTCECGWVFNTSMHLDAHRRLVGHDRPTEKEVAKRVSHPIRYDILDPEFLELMARVADYGAKKYGDFNWQKSRLEGDKSPINHIYKHLKSLRTGEQYDHQELGVHKKWHCVAIAFNAMMEFYWQSIEEMAEKTKNV